MARSTTWPTTTPATPASAPAASAPAHPPIAGAIPSAANDSRKPRGRVASAMSGTSARAAQRSVHYLFAEAPIVFTEKCSQQVNYRRRIVTGTHIVFRQRASGSQALLGNRCPRSSASPPRSPAAQQDAKQSFATLRSQAELGNEER